MKKFLFIAVTLFVLITLVACNNNSMPEIPAIQDEDNTIDVDEETLELPHDWTIEALGATIIAASTFWDDWWSLRGVFAWDEHIDDSQWQPWSEETQHHPLSRGYSILLPSSGFENLNDIGVYLQQFYTESWVDRELFGEGTLIEETGGVFFGSPFAFEEYEGVLYIATARYGSVRPDWTTATHTLIQQNGGGIFVVETRVTAYDHRGSGDEMPTATFTFTFMDGRIESGIGEWVWPGPSLANFGRIIEEEGHFWDSWRNFLWHFDAQHIVWDERILHNGNEFVKLLPSSGFENIDVFRSRLWNYTENWADQLLTSETPPFIEYDGALYINVERPRVAPPAWETVTHVLIEQDDQHAIVETTVGLIYNGEVTHEARLRFTFVGWQIDVSEGFPFFTE